MNPVELAKLKAATELLHLAEAVANGLMWAYIVGLVCFGLFLIFWRPRDR